MKDEIEQTVYSKLKEEIAYLDKRYDDFVSVDWPHGSPASSQNVIGAVGNFFINDNAKPESAFNGLNHNEKILVEEALKATFDPGEVIHHRDKNGIAYIIAFGYHGYDSNIRFHPYAISSSDAKEPGTREYRPEFAKQWNKN